MTDTQDHLVLFMPSGKRGRFAKGTPVIDAARELGVYVESVCGGRGICGRCQIEIQEGNFAKHGITSSNENISPLGPKEQRYAEKRDLKEGRRLSCSSSIEGDLVVDIPQDGQINAAVVRKVDDGRIIERNPALQLCYVEVDEPDMHNPLGDLDRLKLALERDWGWEDLMVDSYLLPRVQKRLRDGNWKVTVAVHQDMATARPSIISIYPGLKNEAYGIACDIGSTTIAMHLVSLLSGSTIASSGAPNPQIRFGEDLMSRVSYVMMNPEGREAMTTAVRVALNALIENVCTEAKVEPKDILDMVFVGNPIMHHLFLGIDPTELGGAPFALAVSGAVHSWATDLDLTVSKGARVYTLPCIAGHVGADAAAVTLCEGPHRQESQMLVVDVGTNAEIVLGNSQRTVAASSPTGPAFEGAEISCGQRAAPGAIERVRIDPETLEPKIRIIGVDKWSDEEGFDVAAKTLGVTGVCGSAIIEVIAEMYLAGIITEDGVVNGSLAEKSDRIIEDGRIKLLMDKLEIEQVDSISFAGAFGTFIDPKYAMVLGLIPDCDLDKVNAVGNAAGYGAKMALLNRGYRREIEETVTKIEKIETALESKFQDHFVNAMALPNKVEAFPKLSEQVKLPEKTAENDGSGDADGGRRRRRRARG
ncbi:Na(+)-translocating NADH-quinone reductase subunit F [Nymphon striatum]|nr:Na(+)-translocating NADH-quinone reductase subunit F [Nymphon striatum]